MKKSESDGKNKLALCLELFLVFFKLGIFTIGGGMAMIPLIQDTITEKKKWMDLDQCVDAIAVCQSLPGVIAINIATYIGQFRAGIAGAISATLGVLTPSYIVIIAVINLLDVVGNNPYVEGALVGLKAAATGLIFYAAFSISKQVVKGFIPALIALGSFLAIGIFDVNGIYVIIAGIIIGLIHEKIGGRK